MSKIYNIFYLTLMSVEYTKYEFLHFSTLSKGLYVIDN